MQLSSITTTLTDFIQTSPLNRVHDLTDLQLFDTPLIGVASAADELFPQLRQPSIIIDTYLLPSDWLPTAKSIISYFLPFTAQVRASNRQQGLPSTEWLYGRIEGQMFVVAVGNLLVDLLKQGGYEAVFPTTDSRFKIVNRRSNWSERHTAFIAGLGTISLNRSLITRVGAAGRLGSVITNLELSATQRNYYEFDENCNHCGACIRRCPAGAISADGKDHAICDAFLESMKLKFVPRYGCGKCQTAVPCEKGIPVKPIASIP
jgi:epoxyqueuosine reductase QueG